MILDPKLLAIEGQGAIEVDVADNSTRLAMIIGPICHWWGKWETPEFKAYSEWRSAMEAFLISNNCLIYCPHKALRGPWDSRGQRINNAAIIACDFVVNITPPGIPAKGTADEVSFIKIVETVPLFKCPPGTDLKRLLEVIQLIQPGSKSSEWRKRFPADMIGV